MERVHIPMLPPPAEVPNRFGAAGAEVNPITIIVDAMRALWLGTPAGNNVWGAVVWSLVLIAIFAPIAVSKYRKAASR